MNGFVQGVRKLVQRLRMELPFAPAQAIGLGLSPDSSAGTSRPMKSRHELTMSQAPLRLKTVAPQEPNR